jgi:transposase
MNNISILGIDLAKTIFQLHGNDIKGRTRLTKKIRRNNLLKTLAKLPKC